MSHNYIKDDGLEDEVMAHRYLYYCIGRPVISDREYDSLEAHARKTLPPGSPVHGSGSDLESSYTQKQAETATAKLNPSPPKQCPKCGAQVMDPFLGTVVVHDVAGCGGVKQVLTPR